MRGDAAQDAASLVNGKFFMRRSAFAVVVALSLLAAACADDGSGPEAAVEEPGATTTSAAELAAPTTTSLAATVSLPDYASEVAGFIAAPDDRSLPALAPERAFGSYGFSRYVYNAVGDDVIPTLIEGPRGLQYRCQSLELDCSYLELKALIESGEPIPAYLGMDREELADLVAQLDAVNAAVNEYPTMEEACAAGFRVSSAQNANMGIHVQNPNGTSVEFDPSRPQMVLYAKDGGERLTQAEQGKCVDGEWTGDPGYESVGAVFTLLLSADHPAGFSGPIDNWHIHFNTCAGSPEEGGVESAEELAAESEGTRGTFSRDLCESAGGSFQEVIPVWMMHAYVDPARDAQGGVFAMFNPSLPPVIDNPGDIERLRTPLIDGALAAPINNFSFGELLAQTGQPIVFSNSDSVPHTVTAGSGAAPLPDFDSGLLGTGESYELTFDTVGEYALFCALHPGMSATVTVE